MLPPLKITTVSEIINIAEVRRSTPISTAKTASTLFKRDESFETEKVSLKNDSPHNPNRHIKSSINIGKKVKAQTSTPHMPTLERNNDSEAVTVESDSAKTPPATGTVEPIINFAVRSVRLSAEEFTTV